MPEAREWRITLPTGEGYYQCAWCPCGFCSEHDLELHLKAFGEEEAIHKIHWQEALRRRQRSGYSRGD